MNYRKTMEYLDSLNGLGSRPGLENISELLTRLENPQNKVRAVHIAGTNGKGSVGAFLTSVLTMAGYRIGRYCSPAVFDPLETISFNGVNISEDDFARVITDTVSVCDENLCPTRFEIETAAAFMFFDRMKCDIAIVECGMGGELDATNVMSDVICSVITPVSMDHMSFLGDTIEKIAECKAGIIKPGVDVAAYKDERYYSSVLTERAMQTQSDIYYIDDENIICNTGNNELVFSYRGYKDIRLNTPAAYQAVNGAIALEVVDRLRNKGYNLTDDIIRAGMYNMKWPGRFEILNDNKRMLILDGAHNPAGAAAFADSYRRLYGDEKSVIILAMFKDKDTRGVLEHIMPLADSVITTMAPDNPRSFPAKDLAEYIKKYYDIEVGYEADIYKAVSLAFDMAGENKVIACGSLAHLALVKEAYRKYGQR